MAASQGTAAVGVPSSGKAVDPKKGNEKPGVELMPMEPRVSLGGQAGVPAYLKFSKDLSATLEGVSRGEVFSVGTNYATKDFVFDLVMKFEKGDNEFVMGLGENTRDANWIIDSVALRWSGRSGQSYLALNKNRQDSTRIEAAGIHLIRMERKGNSLSFTIATREGEAGAFKPVATKTVNDLKKKAGFLTDTNAPLFFAGEATVMSIALSVDGKMVDPGTPTADPKAVAASNEALDKTPMVPLAGAAGFPSWLKGNARVLTDNKGIVRGEVRTAATDLIDKDFVCDLLFSFENEDDQSIPIVGLGENGRDGNWIIDSVYSRVHGPGHKGNCTLAIGKGREERSLGSFGKSPGPHMMRIEKHGPSLTMGVCVDYKDRYVASFARTIPDIKRSAPFLTRLNSALFFELHGSVHLISMRLQVDGKVQENKEAAVAKSAMDDAEIDKVPLVSLAGQAGLPHWLKADITTLAGPDGIHRGELRTTDHDLISKDFTFDLLYEFKEDEKAIILIGLGENGRNGAWIVNSVLSRVHGPGYDGQALATLPGEQMSEPLIGRTAKDVGPHMFRLQKRGNTLTMAICVDYKDKFEATFSKTIPDLPRIANFLNKTNSSIFLGGGGTFKAVRFVIDGKAAEGGNAVASAERSNHGVNAGDPGIEDKTALTSLAGQAGLPKWLKASANTLAGAKGINSGELRTTATDLLNHDFTFDVQYELEEGSKSITIVGLGENGRNGEGITNTIGARLHGPGYDGQVILLLPGDSTIGKTGKGLGPFVFRMQKRGNSLMFALDTNYKGGKFAPAFAQTIPDLSSVAPYLTALNSSLLIEAHTTINAVRLIVDGKPAGGAAVGSGVSGSGTGASSKPTTTAPLLQGGEHFIALQGPKLPPYFTQQRGLKFQNNALVLDDKNIRTVRSDYLNVDFTFDVIYRIDPAQHEPMLVGMGENGREGAWIINSVAAKLHGAVHDGILQLEIGKGGGGEVGKAGKGAGTLMFRMQKSGKVVTVALCPDYKGHFEPTLTRTIPDLTSAAPFLTEKNSFLFLSGKGIVEKVRLVVGGESAESADVVLEIPPRIVEGQALKLRLGKEPGATFAIEKAPKGLTLSAAGELNWKPAVGETGVHELRIKVTKRGQTIVVPGEVEVVTAEDAKAVKGDLTKIETLYRLPIEGDRYQLTTAWDNKSMLLLNADSLRRLGRDGITVLETLKLPAKYTLIGEREGYFVALSDEKQALDIIDKQTLKVKKSIQMTYRNRWDLALHPSKSMCFVTVEKGVNGARDAVLIVDEASGDVFEPENFVGRWIKIAPDGRTAYTGYKDVYKRGSRLLVNPNSIDLIPEYASIDILYVWDISTAHPRCTGMKDSPGLNGFAIALSPDGKRLSYLSFTGYPLYSHNIPAFDPTNFEKRPVTYPTKDNKAESRDLAYHPWLEIAAAPSEDGAVCFDRESGEVLKGMVDLSSPPLGEVKATHVYFSADGRNLLIECDNGADRFLRKVKLNLTAAQIERMQTLEKEGKQLPKPSVPRAGLPKV